MVMSETPLVYDRPSPRLGEHTAEILAELEKPAK
jgi:crotonobetainyl-CoA:carnitine CoA-transferase CaiB-like acyl-CoA transferase